MDFRGDFSGASDGDRGRVIAFILHRTAPLSYQALIEAVWRKSKSERISSVGLPEDSSGQRGARPSAEGHPGHVLGVVRDEDCGPC